MSNISNGGSSSAIELQPVAGASNDQIPLQKDNIDPAEFLPQPSTTVNVVERWNYPRINIYRTCATFFAFIVAGANDAAYGALIPYLEEYYDLSYIVVSLVFLSPLVGYASSAMLNNTIHVHFGQRGVAFLGPICHLCAYIGIALHPPYPVLVVVFILAGFGNGIEDAGWNAFFGNMPNSNEILGFLHGFYGVGAVLSPLAATSLITKAGWPWYSFYYIMIGGAVIELITSLSAFWTATGAVYREANPRTTATKESRLTEAMKSRVTWVAALFLLCYVGVEVALGGWIVTFMRRERDGEAFASGMVATGFWLGIAVGRFVLGFVTPKLGEKFAVMVYLVLSMICQLIFWLVPQFIVSAIAVSLQGFFLAPLFPAAIVVATKALPTYLHVSAIGFAAAFGGGGAAVLPFAIGALAQARGVSILQPVILAILVVLLLLWVMLPAVNKVPAGSPNETSKDQKRWINIDFDLVETGKRTIQKARGTG
ncbi:MFS general substrate transporter [Aaosphaeria arxii CBS 175.79]|uniref:MFS general substrate transporter n=1 Tax=Aaosphaeria arxii CBS 175.79 TaxID=1450172 RepID=A0A6A5XC63_9PLEO|nr:MFS general substrate transporter [Aaosphaeria arxii CBS 175.79]KAF2010499.1 MFS general substrate transporter [Aaosphaeria arxii CBS 175.79]